MTEGAVSTEVAEAEEGSEEGDRAAITEGSVVKISTGEVAAAAVAAAEEVSQVRRPSKSSWSCL